MRRGCCIHSQMAVRRPVFIIAEPEPEQALSARKLVIETAKFNVITAHSVPELLTSIEDFPTAEAIVLHSALAKGGLERLVKRIRLALPGKPIILLSPSKSSSRLTDHAVSSHDPQELVELLRNLFGDPRKIA